MVRGNKMTNKEKTHNIKVAFNLIETVFEDTDEELWASEHLSSAMLALTMWLEEWEI